MILLFNLLNLVLFNLVQFVNQHKLRFRNRQIFTFTLVLLIFCSFFSDERPKPDFVFKDKNDPACPEKFVAITLSNNVTRCWPKVTSEFAQCKFNEQCQIENSYCDINTEYDHYAKEDFKTCICRDGYHAEMENDFICKANRVCQHSGFNDAMNLFGCGRRQFCRRNICLCLPNYEFKQNNTDGTWYCEYKYKKCSSNKLVMIETPVRDCVAVAKVNELCQYDLQCRQLDPNSHCAMKPNKSLGICKCDENFAFNRSVCENITISTSTTTSTASTAISMSENFFKANNSSSSSSDIISQIFERNLTGKDDQRMEEEQLKARKLNIGLIIVGLVVVTCFIFFLAWLCYARCQKWLKHYRAVSRDETSEQLEDIEMVALNRNSE